MNNIVFAGRHALTHNVSRHVHIYWELIYCTSGKGLLSFTDAELRYSKDEIVLIPPMLPHTNESAEGFTNIFINIADPTLSGNRPFKLAADANGFLLDAFSAAFYYYCENSADGSGLLSAYGNLIVSLVLSMHPDDRKNELTKVIESDIIRNFPDSRYDVTAFLSSLPFSNDHLVKIFRKDTGTTPHRYLTDKRLQVAANSILSAQSDNISDIARLCGFREPLYFSRLFKKKYGVSPSFYKEEQSAAGNGSDSDNVKIYID